MKIGVFDSGLGGLVVMQSLIKALPKYDYVYLGDTKNLPYGNKSQADIYKFTRNGVDFLLDKDCGLIIVACNTASARALRKIQREYLPRKHPDAKVLGVIIPTAEVAAKFERVGLLATQSTVRSKAYVRELIKLNEEIEITQSAAPKLVPLIEANNLSDADALLRKYLRPLLAENVEAIILGCTHYPLLRKQITAITGRKIKIIDQTQIIPKKLKDYLRRHPEIDKKLSRGKTRKYFVTGKAK